jgi:hypothetical protein
LTTLLRPWESGPVSEERSVRPELLSGRELALIVLIVLPIFFFENGPIWAHPFAIDAGVYWSYAPIPALVALLLWRRRILGWASFAIGCIGALGLKYFVTLTIATLLWATSSPPEHPVAAAPAPSEGQLAAPKARPEPSRIDPATTGRIDGRVSGPDGAPAAGALVYVRRGLEPLTFAPPIEGVVITSDGRRFLPELAVVHADQPVVLRSEDGRLHTFRGTTARGGFVFNFPILAHTSSASISLSKAAGVVLLACTVHPGQEHGRIVVLGHPFVSRTANDGTFALEGVPAGTLEIAALAGEAASWAEATAEISLAPGQSAKRELRLSLPAR